MLGTIGRARIWTLLGCLLLAELSLSVETHAQAGTFQSINNIQMCDQFPGGDAGAKITNCIAALPATGGIADARGFGANMVQSISSQLNIGSPTKQVTLLVDPSTRFNVSVHNGGAAPAIQIFNSSSLDCGGVGSVNGGISTAGGFYLTSDAWVSALIANGQQDGNQQYMTIRGCLFEGFNNTQHSAVTVALGYFKRLLVNSVVEDCIFLGVGSYTTVNIEAVGVFAWINNWVNGAVGVPNLTLNTMLINGSSAALTIVGGAIEHSGGGLPLLKIDASTGQFAGINALRDIAIYGTYFEQQTGGGNGIEMTNPTSVHLNSVMFGGNFNGTDAIRITETQAGAAQNVLLENIDNFGYPNTINDTASGGFVITDHTVSHYVHNATSYLAAVNAGSGSLGTATITGDLHVLGAIYKGAEFFRIDHPLDPANKYLVHSVVESPRMENIYDGIVTLNARGEAVVALPRWFQHLNRDFRYHLTCIGGFAPVYVSQEIRKNRFRIAGGTPGQRVSWQVTGVRQDTFATSHPMEVEEAKPAQKQSYRSPPE